MVGLRTVFLPAVPKLCPQLTGSEKSTRVRQGPFSLELETTDPENMVKPCGGPGSTRSPKAGTGIKTIACQSPSQADLWGSITLKQTSLQKEKTANIQAKAENMKETETQREPIVFSYLRKAVLRLDSMRSPKFFFINPL